MLENRYQMPDRSMKVIIHREGNEIKIMFSGKSLARDPSGFLNPILHEAFLEASETNKGVTLDFCNLEYMNSATVSPIIKFWAALKDSGIQLSVIYNHEIPWQNTNFSAFSIFTKESKLFKLIKQESS